MEQQYYISANRRIIVKKHEGVTIEEPGLESKSVTLTAKRWSSLVASVLEIDQNLELLENNQYVKFNKHLGGGYYLGVTTGFSCVDIREYYFNTVKNQPLPTKHGVAIYVKYWPKFKEIIEQITRDFPSLSEAEQCSHLTLIELINCAECYPYKEETDSIKEQLALPETIYQ